MADESAAAPLGVATHNTPKGNALSTA